MRMHTYTYTHSRTLVLYVCVCVCVDPPLQPGMQPQHDGSSLVRQRQLCHRQAGEQLDRLSGSLLCWTAGGHAHIHTYIHHSALITHTSHRDAALEYVVLPGALCLVA